MGKWTKTSDEKLAEVVAESTSFAEVLRKLGLRQAGGTQFHYRSRINKLGIDTSHFLGQGHLKGKTSFE